MKSIFASKTFWANTLVILVAAATSASQQEWAQQHVATIAVVIAVLNIFLRFLTTQPVKSPV